MISTCLGVEISQCDLTNKHTFYRRSIERLSKYARDSDSRHAKFATRTLAHTKNKDKVCTEVMEVCQFSVLFIYVTEVLRVVYSRKS